MLLKKHVSKPKFIKANNNSNSKIRDETIRKEKVKSRGPAVKKLSDNHLIFQHKFYRLEKTGKKDLLKAEAFSDRQQGSPSNETMAVPRKASSTEFDSKYCMCQGDALVPSLANK